MVLVLQILCDDISASLEDSIPIPSLNLITASFGEAERAREEKRFFFYFSGLLPGGRIHSIMSKTGHRQVDEAE